jgi:hypothetical protein
LKSSYQNFPYIATNKVINMFEENVVHAAHEFICQFTPHALSAGATTSSVCELCPVGSHSNNTG